MPNNEPQWGYLMNVTPTNELLNLALWISEFLAEEADPARYALTKQKFVGGEGKADWHGLIFTAPGATRRPIAIMTTTNLWPWKTTPSRLSVASTAVSTSSSPNTSGCVILFDCVLRDDWRSHSHSACTPQHFH